MFNTFGIKLCQKDCKSSKKVRFTLSLSLCGGGAGCNYSVEKYIYGHNLEQLWHLLCLRKSDFLSLPLKVAFLKLVNIILLQVAIRFLCCLSCFSICIGGGGLNCSIDYKLLITPWSILASGHSRHRLQS